MGLVLSSSAACLLRINHRQVCFGHDAVQSSVGVVRQAKSKKWSLSVATLIDIY